MLVLSILYQQHKKNILETLTVANNGPEIIGTNYFRGEYAANGYYCLSMNAGVFRLMMPDSRRKDITKMQTARDIVVSCGCLSERDKADAIEILFHDGSNNPFALLLSVEQLDRLPDDDADGSAEMLIYGSGLEVLLRQVCHYRLAKRLPCLRPYKPAN